IDIADPQLWWPNGLGPQNIYDATLTLLDPDGTPLDSHTIRIGIRTITTLRNPGSHPDWFDWTYVVNGRPFFARGANYIPPVDLMLRPMPDKARHMVWMARQAGMNMFRIWSGGTLETEDFYRLCDEYGILMQVESPLGMSTLESQVDPEQFRAVVTDLVLAARNHPALAIYCGGNEWNADLPRNRALVEILRQVTTDLDGTRIFHDVSPWGGNSHNYSVGSGGGGGNYYLYNHDASPFVSEAGNWSTPCIETLLSFIPEHEQKAWPPTRESSFGYHTIYNNDWCIGLILGHAAEYGALRNYDDLPAQSMLTKARADSYMAGHVRSAWPRKSGVTLWELKDVWPAITTSNIDYHGIPKTSYYFIKRAYAPMAVISHFDDDTWPAGSTFRAELHAVSDREELTSATVLAEIFDPQLRRLAAREFTINLPADAATTVGTFQWTLPSGEAFPFLYVATLRRPDGTLVASEPYWLNLGALIGYQAPDRERISFLLEDIERPNAVRCDGQEILFEPIIPPVIPRQNALAFLVASAGSGGDALPATFTLDYHSKLERVDVQIPDWQSDGRWLDGVRVPGLRFDHF
ncbi:MAG TPA: glycoside hydrolase family 2 TIM barrel-domain containing protein, partial [Candidatus Sumerlaeota bacterium]|nr:glycoside hydrolase family 2 TIM barrel-domain containing protein [Candidatus Sumerlaeota bacterium]